MDTQTEVAAPHISATVKKYEVVNGTWPVPESKLPPLDATMAKRAFRALYRHRFHKKWTKPVVTVKGAHRRTWTDNGKMVIGPDRGWHSVIHDLSHWMHRRQYPHQDAHRASAHACVERDLIEQVVKRGWLDVKPKAKKTKAKPDLRAKRLAAVAANLKRWETKAKRAATAIKKLKKQKKYYDKLIIFSLTP